MKNKNENTIWPPWASVGFTQEKKYQLVITKKNNELNQKLTEIVVGIKGNLHSYYRISLNQIKLC